MNIIITIKVKIVIIRFGSDISNDSTDDHYFIMTIILILNMTVVILLWNDSQIKMTKHPHVENKDNRYDVSYYEPRLVDLIANIVASINDINRITLDWRASAERAFLDNS